MNTSLASLRIVDKGSKCLVIEILDSTGTVVASSSPYTTICKLEVGLAVLFDLIATPSGLLTQTQAGRTELRLTGQRRAITLKPIAGPVQWSDLLQLLVNASVIDARSPRKRRTDLTGRLCDLVT